MMRLFYRLFLILGLALFALPAVAADGTVSRANPPLGVESRVEREDLPKRLQRRTKRWERRLQKMLRKGGKAGRNSHWAFGLALGPFLLLLVGFAVVLPVGVWVAILLLSTAGGVWGLVAITKEGANALNIIAASVGLLSLLVGAALVLVAAFLVALAGGR